MKLIEKLMPGLLLATATVLLPTAAESAPPLNIGAPVTVSATPDGLRDNGDGRFVSWDITNQGYEFKLYDSDLNVVKQFTINVMVSVGTPTSVTVVKGAEESHSYILTSDLFNSDGLYEVLFTSGDLYNERGQFLGVLNGNYVYVTEDDNMYVGGSNVIEDVEESQVWIDKYNATLPAWLKEQSSLFEGSMLHSDFGAPAIGIMADAAGSDVVGEDNGYNWFISQQDYEMRNNTKAYANVMPYLFYYHTVDRCNQLIKGLKGGEASSTKATILANAYAVRAWNYMNLAQRFQFTYYGNESKPCVPLVTEFNTPDLSITGVGRSTVKETYDFILADLDQAIALLDGNAAEVSVISPDAPKMMVSVATAYGLRARANLIMHRYAEAEADARSAIAKFDGRPYMASEIHPGGFTCIDDDSWMWGLRYFDEDPQNLLSFQSFMSPLAVSGYSSVTSRKINASLFSQIPASDVRRALFLDGNGQSAALSDNQSPYIRPIPYLGVKYGASRYYDGGTGFDASDYPLMRVEEMYYIVAEAMAMAGRVDEARSYLLSFVNEHRDPAYTIPAGVSPAQLRDMIWLQRRIEFWGEGLSFHDLMRLGKGVNRIGGGYPSNHIFNIAPDDSLLLMRFPYVTYGFDNVALTDENNNPVAEAPVVYTENGEVAPIVDFAYWYDAQYVYTAGQIEYKISPSDLSNHSGWMMITPELPGVGTLPIHFDPETGKVEIPEQQIKEYQQEVYGTDSYTFYRSEEYACASKATKRETGRGYDMKLDIVLFTRDEAGNVATTQKMLVWIGNQPSHSVNMTPESAVYVSGLMFTDADSETITVTGHVDDGYKMYATFIEDGASLPYDDLKSTSPFTGQFSFTQTVGKGNNYLCYLVTDDEGNTHVASLLKAHVTPVPFKESIDAYGEWGEWKNGGNCQYEFGGLVNGSYSGEFLIRRNISNPSIVNIRLLIGTNPFFHGVDRDIIVDLETSLVNMPLHYTGIQADGYESITASDSYTCFDDLQFIGNNRIYDGQIIEIRTCYKYILTGNPDKMLNDGMEYLQLPDHIETILSEYYQPSSSPKLLPTSSPTKLEISR